MMKLSERMIKEATFTEKDIYPEGETLTREAVVLEWAEEVAKLQEENEALKEALQWYVDNDDSYGPEDTYYGDGRKKAEALLVAEAIRKAQQ